jgi:hypothetical protein
MALLGVGVAPTAGAAPITAGTAGTSAKPRPVFSQAGKPKAVKNTQDWSKSHIMQTKQKGAL